MLLLLRHFFGESMHKIHQKPGENATSKQNEDSKKKQEQVGNHNRYSNGNLKLKH